MQVKKAMVCHFKKLQSLKPIPFLGAIWLEHVVLATILGLLLEKIFQPFEYNPFVDMDRLFFYIYVILMGPFIETFLFQMIPVALIKKFCKSNHLSMVGSIFLFSISHLGNGWSGFISSILGGFYYAFSYISWIRNGKGSAVLITMVHHSMYNVFVGVSVLLQ